MEAVKLDSKVYVEPVRLDTIKSVLSELLDERLKPIEEKLKTIESYLKKTCTQSSEIDNSNGVINEQILGRDTDSGSFSDATRISDCSIDNIRTDESGEIKDVCSFEKTAHLVCDEGALLQSSENTPSSQDKHFNKSILRNKSSNSNSSSRKLPIQEYENDVIDADCDVPTNRSKSYPEDTPRSDEMQDEIQDNFRIVPVRAHTLGRSAKQSAHISRDLHGEKCNSVKISCQSVYNSDFNYTQLDNHITPDTAEFDQTMKDINHIIKQIQNGLKMKTLCTGSSVEGLNVGQPHEFDVQILLNDQYTFQQTHPCQITVRDRSKTEVTPLKIQTDMKSQIVRVMENATLPSGWNWFRLPVIQSLSLHRKGYNLALVKTSKNRGKVGVILDLIPCIHLPKTFVQENLNFTQNLGIDGISDQFYLVFHNENSWRTSSSLIEKDLLKSVGISFQQGLRIVKYFTKTFIADDLMPRFTNGDTDITGLNSAKEIYGLTCMVQSYFLKNTLLKLYTENHDLSCMHVVSALLKNIKVAFSSSRMRNSRHFLIENQEVHTMDTHGNSTRICEKVEAIEEHITNCSNIQTQRYPLMNFPQTSIMS